jgi:hypothetical protein
MQLCISHVLTTTRHSMITHNQQQSRIIQLLHNLNNQHYTRTHRAPLRALTDLMRSSSCRILSRIALCAGPKRWPTWSTPSKCAIITLQFDSTMHLLPCSGDSQSPTHVALMVLNDRYNHCQPCASPWRWKTIQTTSSILKRLVQCQAYWKRIRLVKHSNNKQKSVSQSSCCVTRETMLPMCHHP